jgi:hypothetical protein
MTLTVDDPWVIVIGLAGKQSKIVWLLFTHDPAQLRVPLAEMPTLKATKAIKIVNIVIITKFFSFLLPRSMDHKDF